MTKRKMEECPLTFTILLLLLLPYSVGSCQNWPQMLSNTDNPGCSTLLIPSIEPHCSHEGARLKIFCIFK